MWMLGSVFVVACNRPISKFVASEQEVQAPASVKFNNQSEKADTFTWDFGDGQMSHDLNPTHRYLKSGNYTITLVAGNGKKTRTHEQMVKVNPPENALVEIHTPYGNMLVKLYDETPLHQENFIKLAEEGYYDSLLFHRVIQGFMIQGGDPDSRDARRGQRLGGGGPGYQINAEIDPTFIHKKGALSAARTSDAVNPEKKSSGSQFYIVQGQVTPEDQLKMFERRKGINYTEDQKKAYQEQGGTPFLDMEYTVFGEVIEGLEVIDKIAAVSTDSSDRPNEDVFMKVQVIK